MDSASPSAQGKKVALLLESDGPGGAESVVINLACELRDLGYEVIPVGPEDREGWLPERLREEGFETAQFPVSGPLDLGVFLGIRRILLERKVDLVHSHDFTMAVFGSWAARLVGIPHLITMHGGDYYARARRRRMLLGLAVRLSQGTVCVSDVVGTRLAESLSLSSARIRVIHNGVPRKEGDGCRIREELALPSDAVLLLAVGNLYPVKGHIILLEAMKRLLGGGGGKEVVLAVAGRGKQEAVLDGFIREHGMEEQVRLLGFRSDVQDLLAAADIFVMPSLSEGHPLALIEAMLAGKALVASEVGGIPEVVTHGTNGLLVPPGDPEALFQAIRGLIIEPSVRVAIGQAAQRKAMAEFSARTMGARYHEVYQELLET